MTSLIIIVLLLIGWDFAWYLVGVKPLFPWHLKKLLRKKGDQLSLIDVRTSWEYNWFHINGAVNKPELLLDINALPATSKEDPLIVICMTGHRSPLVAYRLKRQGFKKVYNLTWGMLAWKLFGMTNLRND
jgi:rhodanese-related sulfurtransferase